MLRTDGSDGGPAFPAPYDGHGGGPVGMSRRDYFAAHIDPQITASDQYAVDKICEAFNIPTVEVFDNYGGTDFKAALLLAVKIRWAFADLMLAESE